MGSITVGTAMIKTYLCTGSLEWISELDSGEMGFFRLVFTILLFFSNRVDQGKHYLVTFKFFIDLKKYKN